MGDSLDLASVAAWRGQSARTLRNLPGSVKLLISPLPLNPAAAVGAISTLYCLQPLASEANLPTRSVCGQAEGFEEALLAAGVALPSPSRGPGLLAVLDRCENILGRGQ
jgi:hypothetical protein